ncbi:allantoinase AllB [Rhodococcus aerolatus]
MGETVLRADRVVTPEGERAAEVVVVDGVITEVRDHTGVPATEVPAGHVLLPGLVDSHVHVNEPGRTEWEGFATATAAAAAGGVTTIADMPLNSIPPTVDVAALRAKHAATTGKLAVDVACWGGAVPGNVADLRPLHEAGVVGFKCFLLPSGVEEFPPLDDDGLTAALTEIATFDGLLIAHAEDEAHLGPAPRGRRFADFVASRPPAAETAAVTRLVAAARRTGARVHVVHVSAAETLPVLAAAKADGVRITAETCPHYLHLTAGAVPDGATEFKCCPPIRGEADRDALWDGLRAGVIDLVVSDHSPCSPAEKRFDVGDFDLAWGGIASLQLGLPVVWTQARRRGVRLAEVVGWMATAPAAFLGLPDRGAVAVGRRADLCVLAPEETFVVDPARLAQRHPVTAYAGETLHGVVTQTWLAGAPVAAGERRGRLVARGGAA